MTWSRISRLDYLNVRLVSFHLSEIYEINQRKIVRELNDSLMVTLENEIERVKMVGLKETRNSLKEESKLFMIGMILEVAFQGSSKITIKASHVLKLLQEHLLQVSSSMGLHLHSLFLYSGPLYSAKTCQYIVSIRHFCDTYVFYIQYIM